MNVTVAQAAALLREMDDILILTHRRPDGDTTGCAGALCRALQKLGKTAYILQNPEVTPRYASMIVPCYAPESWQPRFVVTTDIADFTLFPANAKVYEGKIDLVIDHHRSNPGIGKSNLIRPDAGSCAEVVYDVLLALAVPLDVEVARCLYVGLSTDTGCFRYSNTMPNTLRAAAACLEAGVDSGEINRVLFELKTRARIELECMIWQDMEFVNDGHIAIVCLRRSELDRLGANMDDLDSIAAMPRRIAGVDVGITLTENKDGTVKASVRTTKEVDASAICQLVGGGGHLRAGGAAFPVGTDLAQARAHMLKAAEDIYNASGL